MPEDVLHFYRILSCIPIDSSLNLTFPIFSSCWPGLGSILRRDIYSCLYCVVLHNDKRLYHGICQGVSWQHLHQPCVAGKV